jgi:hypothetical protein
MVLGQTIGVLRVPPVGRVRNAMPMKGNRWEMTPRECEASQVVAQAFAGYRNL